MFILEILISLPKHKEGIILHPSIFIIILITIKHIIYQKQKKISIKIFLKLHFISVHKNEK